MAVMRSALFIRSWKRLTAASGGCNAYAKGCGKLNRRASSDGDSCPASAMRGASDKISPRCAPRSAAARG